MGQTLISQRALAEIEDVVDASHVGEIELKGFRDAMVVHEVRGLR
jgi:class 3 adenylate cyclase